MDLTNSTPAESSTAAELETPWPVDGHQHGVNCQTVMKIRNTTVDEGTVILDAYVSQSVNQAVREFAERVKASQRSYTGLTYELDIRAEVIDAELAALSPTTSKGKGE